MNFYKTLIKRAVKYTEQLTKAEKYNLYILKQATIKLLKENPGKKHDDTVKVLIGLFGLKEVANG